MLFVNVWVIEHFLAKAALPTLVYLSFLDLCPIEHSVKEVST